MALSGRSPHGSSNVAQRRLSGIHYILWTYALCLGSLQMAESTFSTLVGWGTEQCFVIRPHKQGHAFIGGTFECLDEDEGKIGEALSVTLYDAEDKVVWSSSPGDLTGHFRVSADGAGSQRHRFCIQNNFGKHLSEEAEQDHRHRKHKSHAHQKKKNGGDDDDDDDDDDDNVGVNNAKADLHVGFALHVMHSPDAHHPSEKAAALTANETETHSGVQDDPLTDVLFNYSTVLLDEIMDLADHFEYMKYREGMHRDRAEAVFAKVSYWTIIEALLVVSISLAQVFYLRTFFEQRRSL